MKRMNWFDLLLLAIGAFYLVSGFVQGALKQLFSLFGFFIVLALAFLGSPYLSGFATALLRPEHFITYEEALQSFGVSLPAEKIMQLAGAALAFLGLLIILMILLRLLLRVLTAVNRVPVIGIVNRFGGALLGLLTAALLGLVLINIAAILPIAAVDEAVSGSLIAGYLNLYLPPLFSGVKGKLIDYFLRGSAGGGV